MTALQEEKASLGKLVELQQAQVNDLTEKLEAVQVGGEINYSIEYICAFLVRGQGAWIVFQLMCSSSRYSPFVHYSHPATKRHSSCRLSNMYVYIFRVFWADACLCLLSGSGPGPCNRTPSCLFTGKIADIIRLLLHPTVDSLVASQQYGGMS